MYTFRQIKERDTISITQEKILELLEDPEETTSIKETERREKLATKVMNFIDYRFLNDFVLKVTDKEAIIYYGFKFYDNSFELSISYFNKKDELFDTPLVFTCTDTEKMLAIFKESARITETALDVIVSTAGILNILELFFVYKGSKLEEFTNKYLKEYVQTKVKKQLKTGPIRKIPKNMERTLQEIVGDDIEAVHQEIQIKSREYAEFAFQHCFRSMFTAFDNGYAINDYILNRAIEYKQLHKDITAKPRNSKKESTTPKAVKTRDITLEGVKVVYKSDNINHSTNRKSITRHTEKWEVTGHQRHYKNGKTVFVKPYTKGNKQADKTMHSNYLVE